MKRNPLASIKLLNIKPAFSLLFLLQALTATVLWGDLTIIDSISTGGSPSALKVHPFLHKLYVYDSYGSEIRVIDLECDTLIAEIPVTPGENRFILELDVTNNWIFAATVRDFQDFLYKIDCLTDSILAQKILGSATYISASLSPQTNSIFWGLEGGKIYRLDEHTLAVIDSFTTSYGLIEIISEVVDFGIFVYALRSVANTIAVIEWGANPEIMGVAISPYSDDMCLNPFNHSLYITHRYQNHITVVDPLNLRPLATINIANPAKRIAYSTALNHVYALIPNPHKVAVIDAATNSVVQYLPLQRCPISIAVDSHTGLAYIGCSNGKVYVIQDK
ncbi:MAG: hypothetical protein J7K11_03495 [Candidatus Hydrothermae bacterium]|nr:hypothetical protein [Candidatus Hydrothermae bacterium]